MKKYARLPIDALSFIWDIFEKKNLIYELVKRDFSQRFVGSWLGIFWAFIEPLVMTLIFWLVFGGAFRGSGKVGDFPFIVWFLPAMIAWNYFSDVFNSGTSVIRAFSFLVKKVDFKLNILPIVKILSSLILHFIFLAITVIFMLIYGNYPSFYWVQSLYYIFAASLLLLGVTWVTSSVSLFVKDVQNIAGIIIRVGFYGTPIFWSLDIVPEKYKIIFKLNPAYYIVEGYRNSFVYNKPFWEEPWLVLYFWSLVLISLIFGIIVYRKLRPHFADVI